MIDTEFVTKARTYALKMHGQQTYASQFPYISHLEMVAAVLREFGHQDDVMLASAYLHDIIEDTRVTYQDLKLEFGKEVAEIVYCVTDELGRNRRERHIKTYPKTRENSKAIILKLADRIANVTFSLKEKSDKLEMYRQEHESFKLMLDNGKDENKEMWQRLDNLFLKGK